MNQQQNVMNLKRTSFHLLSTSLLVLALWSTAFSQTEKKVAHGILIDNSGSLRSQFPVVINVGKGIVEKTYQRGPISLFRFQPPPELRRPLVAVLSIEWSQDRNLIDRNLENAFVVGGQTALSDGIDVIASHLNEKVGADKDAYTEKMIFLITDGEERSSKISEKDLIKTLKASGIKVYAVGLVQELDNEGGLIRKPKKEQAIDFLKRITKETGGRAVFPKSKKVDVNAVMNELFAK